MRIVMYIARSLYIFISFVDGFKKINSAVYQIQFICLIIYLPVLFLFFVFIIFDHLAKERGFWQHNVIFAIEKLLSV